MIFITGDIHGDYDIHKFSTKNFPMQKRLTRSDYMIICGDFGLVWDNSKSERYWLNWLEQKTWTTLFIDGNHENFDLLESYPLTEWNGTQVHQITEHIIHLCRGSVFELENKRFFAFGGAESHDKKFRKKGISFWEQEMPNSQEMQHGRENLEKINWQTDIIITHTLPHHLQAKLFKHQDYKNNALTKYFDEIETKLNFKFWFSGHYHISKSLDEKHVLVYHNILQLTDNGFSCVYPPIN